MVQSWLSPPRRSVLAALVQYPSSDLLWNASGVDPGLSTAHHLAGVTSLPLSTVKHALTWLRGQQLVTHTWPLSQPWRATERGIEALAGAEVRTSGPRGRPKGSVLFTHLDRCLVWVIGSSGCVNLEQGALAYGVTYGGMRKALNKAQLQGLLVQDENNRPAGWFFGRLTSKGAQLFRDEFPGHVPVHE